MFSVDLSTREWDGHVVVALGGELDLLDAADVETALMTVAAREPEIIVDLVALEFIDSGGVAALARGRTHARHGRTRWPDTIVQSGTLISGAEHGSPRQQTGEAGASPPPHSRTAEPMTVKDGPAFPSTACNSAACNSAARNTPRRDPATVVPFPGYGDDR